MEASMNRMEKTLNKILTVLERAHGLVLEDWDEPGGPFEATLENSENEYIPESEVLLYGGETTEPKSSGLKT